MGSGLTARVVVGVLAERARELADVARPVELGGAVEPQARARRAPCAIGSRRGRRRACR